MIEKTLNNIYLLIHKYINFSYNFKRCNLMGSCEFVTFISTLACTIAKGKSQKEINILAAFFTQLGDTLATISTIDSD